MAGSADPPAALSSFHPIARSGAAARRDVARVGKLAAVERQAAAADALGEPGAQPFELGDARLNALRPGGGQLRPVVPLRHAVARQAGELVADLLERQPDLLREHDERDAANHRPRVAAVAGAGA